VSNAAGNEPPMTLEELGAPRPGPRYAPVLHVTDDEYYGGAKATINCPDCRADWSTLARHTIGECNVENVYRCGCCSHYFKVDLDEGGGLRLRIVPLGTPDD
jgi:hypothetical protein